MRSAVAPAGDQLQTVKKMGSAIMRMILNHKRYGGCMVAVVFCLFCVMVDGAQHQHERMKASVSKAFWLLDLVLCRCAVNV